MTKTFNLSISMPNTAPVGNVPTTLDLRLTPAEAIVLRQLRDGFVTSGYQTNGGVDKTIKILLDQIATALASA